MGVLKTYTTVARFTEKKLTENAFSVADAVFIVLCGMNGCVYVTDSYLFGLCVLLFFLLNGVFL